jgi:hypothetical protein
MVTISKKMKEAIARTVRQKHIGKPLPSGQYILGDPASVPDVKPKATER